MPRATREEIDRWRLREDWLRLVALWLPVAVGLTVLVVIFEKAPIR